MKKKYLAFIIATFIAANGFAQYRIDPNRAMTEMYGVGQGEAQVFNSRPSCNDLLRSIQTNATLEVVLNSATLNSSWLSQVDAYTYDGKIYIVASIQRRTYIYCGTTNEQWEEFTNTTLGTYGERFNIYIAHNNCNCN